MRSATAGEEIPTVAAIWVLVAILISSVAIHEICILQFVLWIPRIEETMSPRMLSIWTLSTTFASGRIAKETAAARVGDRPREIVHESHEHRTLGNQPRWFC